jgi:hypothetical protein
MKPKQVWRRNPEWHNGDNGVHRYILRIEGDIVFYKNVNVDGKMIKPTLDGNDVEFEGMTSRNAMLASWEMVR